MNIDALLAVTRQDMRPNGVDPLPESPEMEPRTKAALEHLLVAIKAGRSFSLIVHEADVQGANSYLTRGFDAYGLIVAYTSIAKSQAAGGM